MVVEHKGRPAAPIQRGEWRRLKPRLSTRLIEAIPRFGGSPRRRFIVATSCLIALAAGASAAIIWLPPKPVPPPIVSIDVPVAPVAPALNLTPENKVALRRAKR